MDRPKKGYVPSEAEITDTPQAEAIMTDKQSRLSEDKEGLDFVSPEEIKSVFDSGYTYKFVDFQHVLEGVKKGHVIRVELGLRRRDSDITGQVESFMVLENVMVDGDILEGKNYDKFVDKYRNTLLKIGQAEMDAHTLSRREEEANREIADYSKQADLEKTISDLIAD